MNTDNLILNDSLIICILDYLPLTIDLDELEDSLIFIKWLYYSSNGKYSQQLSSILSKILQHPLEYFKDNNVEIEVVQELQEIARNLPKI